VIILDKSKLRKDIDAILCDLDNAKFKGYDPYDIKGTKFYLWLFNPKQSKIWVILRYLVNLSIFIFPNFVRRVFSIKPKYYPKALGLIIHSNALMYKKTKDPNYLNRAKQIYFILQSIAVKTENGIAWGHPDDWQSKIFIPKNTPCGLVSAIVGFAFLELYNVTNEKKYLNDCINIANFLVKDLGFSYSDEKKVCFRYTPQDNYMVHNENLTVASYLMTLGICVNQKEYIDIAERAIKFSLEDLTDDGFLYYDHFVSDAQTRDYSNLDLYHNGFDIRALYNIWLLTKSKKYKNAVYDYYKWYKSFYISGSVPYLKKYTKVVDIHGCAEALLICSLFEDGKRFEQIYGYIKSNMFPSQGKYYYQIKYYFGKPLISKINYVRWGQSWMLFALVNKYCG